MLTPIYTAHDAHRIITPEMCDELFGVALDIEERQTDLGKHFEEQAQQVLRQPVGVIMLRQTTLLEHFNPLLPGESDGKVKGAVFLRGGFCMLAAIDAVDVGLVQVLDDHSDKKMRRHQRKEQDFAVTNGPWTSGYQQLQNLLELTNQILRTLNIYDQLGEIEDAMELDSETGDYLHIGAGWITHEAVTSIVRQEKNRAKRVSKTRS